MIRRSFVVCGVAATVVFGVAALAGCVSSRAVEAPSPRSESWEGPVVVWVPEDMGSEEMLNLPKGSLTHEAALVNANDQDVCFDVKMRTWQGATPQWDVALEVDEDAIAESKIYLRSCTRGSVGPADPMPMTLSCLPVDTAVASVPTDAMDAVQVRGERVCLKHGGKLTDRTERVSLKLKQGAAQFEFVWQFADDRR